MMRNKCRRCSKGERQKTNIEEKAKRKTEGETDIRK